jgi:hypothetical protein
MALTYDTVFTDTYMYSYKMDDCFDEDYDPTSTISMMAMAISRRPMASMHSRKPPRMTRPRRVITRATPVLGAKVEGTTADSTMADTLGYISTWKVWDEMDLMTDTTKYMSSNTWLGYRRAGGLPGCRRQSFEVGFLCL